MLCSPVEVAPEGVGDHYDQLDELYRSIWGTTLHHGLWSPGDSSSVELATNRLLKLILLSLSINPGARLIDIGCGYGADAHHIAELTGASVSGITISRAQATKARKMPLPGNGNVSIEHGDWLQNTYPAENFDCAIALESLSHIQDKKKFFSELHRVLVPGGRAAIACWTINPEASIPERILLRILCVSGALPSLGSIRDYRTFAHKAELSFMESRDLTAQVAPTWSLIARNTLRALMRPRLLVSSLKIGVRRPLLFCAIPSMILAFHTGALCYSALWVEKKH